MRKRGMCVYLTFVFFSAPRLLENVSVRRALAYASFTLVPLYFMTYARVTKNNILLLLPFFEKKKN